MDSYVRAAETDTTLRDLNVEYKRYAFKDPNLRGTVNYWKDYNTYGDNQNYIQPDITPIYYDTIAPCDIKKNESELDMGLYRDKNGDFIYRKVNDEGEPLESDDDFIRRVEKNSDEFNQIMQVAEWIDSELQTSIFVDDVSDAYDDKTLEFKIRKAKMTLGCNYWFYDTFKSDTDDTGDWAAMMNSATKLATVAKETETFGYLSIQLLDEIASVDPDRVSSTHIANCKAIKRVMYTMMLFKEILANEFSRYEYLQVDEDWGEPQRKPLQEGHRYYCCNVDKNRFGRKPKVLFELDLDKNTWRECGELVRK